MERVFLCIGAGPGIGLATAMKFAREGFRVALCARNQDRLEQLALEIKKETGQLAETVRMDAGDFQQFPELKKRLGDVDVLHYNAAIVHAQTLEQASYADLREDIAVGVSGALYAIKTFAPAMLARRTGAILLTGGALALHPLPQYLALGIAKAGIRNMAEALFADFRKNDVHIASVTVAAAVAPNSREAQEVSEIFWKLYGQAPAEWSWNVDYVKP